MKNWKMASMCLILCGCIIAVTACGGKTKPSDSETSADGEKNPQVTWKLAHTCAEQTAIHRASLEMSENIKTQTEGKFVIDVYPNSQLGSNREVLESLQFGTCELDVPNVALLSGYSSQTAAFELPYLIQDDEAGAKVYDSDVILPAIEQLEPSGIKWIGSWYQGWRHLTTKNTAVYTPGDMKGLKIRTMDSQIHMDHFNTLGASAVPMAFSEVFTGLQQGAIDGQENPYSNIYTQGMYEVQKYIIETGHIYDVTPLLVSTSEFDKLPENYQKLILDQGKEMAVKEREYSVQENEEYKQKILDLGKVTIIELSPEERQVFRDAAQPVYDKWADSIGKDFINSIEAAQQ